MAAGETTTEPPVADALVVFGITGDLAQQDDASSRSTCWSGAGCSTARSSASPASDWSDDALREHALEAVKAPAMPFSKKVFDRFAARLSYVQGDFAAGRRPTSG